MSTTYQAVPAGPATESAAERLRLMGKKMGLWNHGFDFARVSPSNFFVT